MGVGGSGALVATVVGLWRYPVKSMQGERLGAATVQADGLGGDRRWGVRDEQTGRVLTGRREPRLLDAVATLGDDGGEPTIMLPDGARLNGLSAETHAALGDWLGRPVRLITATGLGERAEYFADATDDASSAIEWTMPPGRLVDAMPLLMLTTASLRAGAALYPDGEWDVRRFRPNVLLDAAGQGWVEDAWCGQALHIGDLVEVTPRQPCVRCTMVTRPQSGLVRDLDIYRTLARHHHGNLGVWTAVRTTGTIAEGDSVYIDTAPAPDTVAS